VIAVLASLLVMAQALPTAPAGVQQRRPVRSADDLKTSASYGYGYGYGGYPYGGWGGWGGWGGYGWGGYGYGYPYYHGVYHGTSTTGYPPGMLKLSVKCPRIQFPASSFA